MWIGSGEGLGAIMNFWFQNYRDRLGDKQLADSWLHGELFSKIYASKRFPIYCALCNALSFPVLQAGHAREQLSCGSCGLNARLRSSIGLMEEILPSPRSIYMTEQVTPAFALMQKRHANISGSEYQPDPEVRAMLAEHLLGLGGHGDVVFGDITRLELPERSVDAILSFDVLEHVPDYKAAFSEFARVLSPGGLLLATFPFTDGEHTMVRAEMRIDGSVTHFMEPEYHGDPISGGVLCFYHFGWDVLDEVRAAGFSSAHMVMPWAPQRGFLYGMWNLVARR